MNFSVDQSVFSTSLFRSCLLPRASFSSSSRSTALRFRSLDVRTASPSSTSDGGEGIDFPPPPLTPRFFSTGEVEAEAEAEVREGGCRVGEGERDAGGEGGRVGEIARGKEESSCAQDKRGAKESALKDENLHDLPPPRKL